MRPATVLQNCKNNLIDDTPAHLVIHICIVIGIAVVKRGKEGQAKGNQ